MNNYTVLNGTEIYIYMYIYRYIYIFKAKDSEVSAAHVSVIFQKIFRFIIWKRLLYRYVYNFLIDYDSTDSVIY